MSHQQIPGNNCTGQPLLPKELAQPPLRPLRLGEIRPAGWLATQMKLEASGLVGNLDTFWPSIKDSAWTGGTNDGWERMPYWLDGAVPLAWLSGDDALKARVSGYIDYILTHQDEEGWFGPPQDNRQAYDMWATILVFKPLVQYYELTGDERVVGGMSRALERLNIFLDGGYLFSWGESRWFDVLIPVCWLYEKTGNPKLMELATKAQAQGFDWISFLKRWPYTQPRPSGGWNYTSHVVNCAMAPRQPALWWRITGDERDRQSCLEMLDTFDHFHGTVWGGFSGDECVAGKNPIQGAELCSVVEYMFSLENVVSVTGDPAVADRLEKVSFNALPAACSADMWTHQYHQQVNQVQCVTSDPHVFYNSGPQANLFGVEPNYGCCTANMGQGWPKLTASLWMATDDGGLAAVVYAPCEVKTKVGDADVQVKVSTEYPFREQILIDLTTDRPARFPLKLRIPAWAQGATVTVNGRTTGQPVAGRFMTIEQTWDGHATIELVLPMKPRAQRRYNNAMSITRGPLVYALKIGEDWQWVNKENPQSVAPHQDWELRPTTPWNYALDLDEEEVADLDFVEKPLGELPFAQQTAAVEAQVRGRRLEPWGLERSSAATVPVSPVRSSEPDETLMLIPYGCARLRVTEFPTLK